MAWFRAFGRFWYDFIVGDSVVLAIGVVALLLVGWLFTQALGAGWAELLLPLAVGATLALSVLQRD